MYYLTIHGRRGDSDTYTFTPYTHLGDALLEIGSINQQRRWSGLGNATFSLVRKPAPWQRAG